MNASPSVCPPSNPYLFSQNKTIPSSSSSLIACANGVLAKRAEDCPLVTTPQEPDCPMMGTTSTSSYNGNAMSSVASLMSSVGTIIKS